MAGAAFVAAPFLGGVTSTVQAANTRVPVGRTAHAQAGKFEVVTKLNLGTAHGCEYYGERF